ncbi:valyl-tRNA synthetase [Pedobacter sp. BAL39]|nr:valyl-tRNA synthetase [Pedobacter sp. BAL39]
MAVSWKTPSFIREMKTVSSMNVNGMPATEVWLMMKIEV